MNENQSQGLALLCDLQGLIIQVLRDDLKLVNTAPGKLFIGIVENASRTKAMNFLSELTSQGAALDWEINVSINGGIQTLHFAGGSTGDSLLITAGANGQLAERLYEDMLRINNEQTNLLRTALKDKAETSNGASNLIYDEISHLNNDLISMQRELAGKNAELARLNTLKNQFLGMAAHDLRNPLQNILFYSGFLMDDAKKLDAEQIEFINSIHSQSQYMSGLINDLLDVAIIESGKLQLDLQPVDFVNLVKANMNRNQMIAARKKITLNLEAGAIPTILLDAAKMEQVLDNLITNAVKYSPLGSHVYIHLSTTADDEVMLSVQDEGPGIPDAEMDRLFKPFQRTSVKSTAGEKSVGLGLVIVKRIVVGHGGRIWVENKPGSGCIFYVAIPISK